MSLHDDQRIAFTPADLLAPTNQLVMREHLDRYRFASSRVPWNARVLDLGCGVGYGAFILAQAGAVHVTAVDVDEEAIDYAQIWFRHPRVQYHQVNLNIDSPLTSELSSVELVTLFEVLEHVAEPERLLEKIFDCLVPNGMVIASAPIVITVPDNRWHLRDFTVNSLKGIMSRQFTILETAIQNDQTMIVSAVKPQPAKG